MKILFAAQNLDDYFRPLGQMQLSSVAKKRGDQTDLTILSQENILDKIEKEKPDMIAFSSPTGEYLAYESVNRLIKSAHPEVFTIIGGPHPTFFPEIIQTSGFDAIGVGECENPFLQLLSKLETGEDISKINNIIVKGGKLNGLEPLIQNLDSLPFPDRNLFYRDYIESGKKPVVMNFMAGRGCPFSCTYCFNHTLRKSYSGQNYLRKHSVEYVLEEIAETREKLGFKFVRFWDDVFVHKEDSWFKEFCEEYPKKIGLPFSVLTRFNLMTPGIAKSLSKSGCKSLVMAIESANPRIRKEILKRDMSDEQIIEGARYCRENNISVVTCVMTGLPTSTLEDEKSAVDLCIKAKIPVPEFFIYQPYPRTDLGERCIAEKWFDGDISSIQRYGFSHPSILTCFNEKEKNAQINLSLLGPLTVRRPYLRDLVLNHLIHLPRNKIFEMAYSFEKMITYPSKVYPTNYSWAERWEIFKKGINLEKNKRIKDYLKQE